MGAARTSFPRRKNSDRKNGDDQKEAASADPLLKRWRRMLAAMESEAKQHHCAEIQMLVGMAALAVDDMINGDGQAAH